MQKRASRSFMATRRAALDMSKIRNLLLGTGTGGGLVSKQWV